MELNEYQKEAKASSHVEQGSDISNLLILGLGIAGEAGEVADEIKKLFRDHNAEMTEAWKMRVGHELGDALWYISQIASMAGFSLEEVARDNIAKIRARKRGKDLPFEQTVEELQAMGLKIRRLGLQKRIFFPDGRIVLDGDVELNRLMDDVEQRRGQRPSLGTMYSALARMVDSTRRSAP